MAPPPLREAAEGRLAELQKAHEAKGREVAALDGEVAAKREEKSIAAQSALRELLKSKEALQQEARNISSASQIVERALAKLRRAAALGIDDWATVLEEKVKLSDFARARLEKEPESVAKLRKKVCDGHSGPSADLELQDGQLLFAGDQALLPKLLEALSGLESNYETRVNCDDEVTLHILESRGEFSRVAARIGVNIAQEGPDICVYGPPEEAEKAARRVRGLLVGRTDIDCPKPLMNALIAKAKDVEPTTGAIIDAQRSGGWGNCGIIRIRGEEDCVAEATEAIRAWLDEKEGAVSEFIYSGKAPVCPTSGSQATSTISTAQQTGVDWQAHTLNQLRGDLQTLGGRKKIKVKDIGGCRQIELRGAPGDVATGKAELEMMLDFYRKQEAGEEAHSNPQAAGMIPEPTQEELSVWGAAPTAQLPTTWNWIV